MEEYFVTNVIPIEKKVVIFLTANGSSRPTYELLKLSFARVFKSIRIGTAGPGIARSTFLIKNKSL